MVSLVIIDSYIQQKSVKIESLRFFRNKKDNKYFLNAHVSKNTRYSTKKNVGIFRLYNNQYDLIQFKWVHQTGKFRLFESCNSLQDYFEQILTPPQILFGRISTQFSGNLCSFDV